MLEGGSSGDHGSEEDNDDGGEFHLEGRVGCLVGGMCLSVGDVEVIVVMRGIWGTRGSSLYLRIPVR